MILLYVKLVKFFCLVFINKNCVCKVSCVDVKIIPSTAFTVEKNKSSIEAIISGLKDLIYISLVF